MKRKCEKNGSGVKGGPEGCLFKRNRCGGAADAALLFYFSHAALWLKDSMSPPIFGWQILLYRMNEKYWGGLFRWPPTVGVASVRCSQGTGPPQEQNNTWEDVYSGDVCCFLPFPSPFRPSASSYVLSTVWWFLLLLLLRPLFFSSHILAAYFF